MMESTNPPAQSRAGRNHTEVDRLKLKSAAKHAAALLLGILILNGFCAWYYNPAPYEKSPDRATDVVRRPGAVNAQAKEGIGVHRIDANGYNNPAMGDGEAVAVLMMGSSHTEGFNVPEGCDVSSLLGEKLRAAGREGRVYNIGMSAHNFKNCARNLANALERFRPTDCVVIETSELAFRPRAIRRAMAGKGRRRKATSVPLPALLSDRPLSKRLYKQFMGLMNAEDEEAAESFTPKNIHMNDDQQARYTEALTAWFTQLSGTAAAAGVKLVIWYHPRLTPTLDGGVESDAQQQCLACFREACAAAGVVFVDMSGPFLDAYAERAVLPAGFANTALGVGHLNREGHRMAAEALFEAIEAAVPGEGACP